MQSVPRTDHLLALVLRSIRDRRALCALVLATYRVELTSALHRMADGSLGEGDALLVHDIAGRIAEAAGATSLDALRREALTLQRRAAAAHGGGAREEGEMLSIALKVIDRILAAARTRRPPPAEPAGTDLN